MREKSGILLGWAEVDITPPRSVLLGGQFHARVSEGVQDPLFATVLAIGSSGEDGRNEQAVMVTCDLVTISDELRDATRAIVAKSGVGVEPLNIFIGATHTHTAPDTRMAFYGSVEFGSQYVQRVKAAFGVPPEEDKYGIWPPLDLDIMPPADYLQFAAQRIAEAIVRAWEARRPAGIAYGVGHAMISHNRRLTYADGNSVLYGKPELDAFRNVEGYEDQSVYTLTTYDENGKLTGMVVNVSCPSQVSENSYLVSADFWHETRQELRRRFGQEVFILPQCAPAGDLSPHVLIGKRAEARMWRLKGHDVTQNAPRAEIAQRIANAISEIEPYIAQEIDWNPKLIHTAETLHLPRRLISEQDVQEALEQSQSFKDRFEELVTEYHNNPEFKNKPRWYLDITKAYRRMERGERVRMRLEMQKNNPNLPVEVHVVRLGETAFATNPFELYLDYAIRIREQSHPVQTFLIQKAGCNGTYLPTARSVAHKGYGSEPASTDVGPEGGEQLVEWTVRAINQLFEDQPDVEADG